MEGIWYRATTHKLMAFPDLLNGGVRQSKYGMTIVPVT